MFIFTRATQITGASRAPFILVGNILPFVFTSIFVIARLCTRAFITRSWGGDDTVLSFAYISCTITIICSCVQTQYGTGHHSIDVPLNDQIEALKYAYVALITYQLTLSLTKISICIFYIRLFVDKTGRRLARGTFIFVILYTIPLEALSIFQCTPISSAWDLNLKNNGSCINVLPVFYISAGLNVLTDVWLIVIIIPRIYHLKMPIRQKISLFVVVTLGWLVAIAAIVRVVRVSTILSKSDMSWSSYDTSIWSAVEVCMGLFCVAAPAIKPLLQYCIPGILSSLSGGHTYSNENYPGKGTRGNTTFIRTGNRNTQNGIELHSKSRDGDLFVKDGSHSGGGTSKGATYKSGLKFRSADNDSTENVLATDQEEDGILRTTNVTVDIEHKSTSESVDSMERQEAWRHNI